MPFQGRGGGHRPLDGSRPVPCRSPVSGILHRTALPPPTAAAAASAPTPPSPAAPDLEPSCLPRPARRGLGTICVVGSSSMRLGDDYEMRTGITPILSQLIFSADDKVFGDTSFQTGSHSQLKEVGLPDRTPLNKCHHGHSDLTTVAAHVLPPPMVNVFFCGYKIRIPAIGETVLDLVQLALLKQNIRIPLQDFYLMLNFKTVIDGSLSVNSIPNLDESTICVCPRLRGGANTTLPMWYAQLDDVINNNADKLFSKLQIPQGMVDPNCPHGGVAIFWSELTQFVIHRVLLLVCLDGHFEDHCYHGHFDLSRVLMSPSGHVRFRDDVYEDEVPYTPEGGEADYLQLFAIVMTFANLDEGRLPTHVKFLLKVLRNAHESLRRKREFIAFVVNHPALLSFPEKHMLYIMIDAFLSTLLETTFTDPNDLAEIAALKTWLQGTAVAGCSGWEQSVQNVTVFWQTYMHGAKRPKGAPMSSRKVSVYKSGADHCLHLSRNFLSHKYNKVGLKLAEAAVSYLFDFILPVVLFNLAMCLSGENGDTLVRIVSNPRANRRAVRQIMWP